MKSNTLVKSDTTAFVVDDDPAVRDSLKAFLEAHGLAVRDFASAEQFLTTDHVDAKGCLVLDVHLPAMGGFDLLRLLGLRGIVIPTVMISGCAGRALQRRAQAAGVAAVVEKPFDGAMLLAAIERAVL